MKKSYSVAPTFNDMRIDRWIRNNLGKIPQGLIEKNLRNEKIITQNEAVILSMTKKERDNPRIIDGSRKKRIANGSGTDEIGRASCRERV